MKTKTYDIPREMLALTGRVVTRLLSTGVTVTPHILIEALNQFRQDAETDEDRLKYTELIDLLMRKLH